MRKIFKNRRYAIPIILLAVLILSTAVFAARGGMLLVNGITAGSYGIRVGAASNGYDKFTVAASTGNTAVKGTMTVTGATAMNGGITCDTNKFTVADTSGNVATAGTLTATGATALNGGLTMDTNKFVVADTSGNTTIGGTLAVTGAQNFTGATTITSLANYTIGTINTDTTGTVAVTAADTGELFVATKSDGATTYTLPDPSAATVGKVFRFVQTADQNMIVVPTTADGNSIVADGVATSDKVSIETGSHKIGGSIIVIGISATKWLAVAGSGATMTIEAAD